MGEIRSNNQLAARLEHRYPGVRCTVEWSEAEPSEHWGKGHALWMLRFICEDRARLIGYGLASAAQFEALAQRRRWYFYTHDGLGNRVSIYEQAPPDRPKVYEVSIIIKDYDNNDEKPFTKKVQVEVARALKPFVRGRWTPAGR
jgi:hypothetical protein